MRFITDSNGVVISVITVQAVSRGSNDLKNIDRRLAEKTREIDTK